MNVCSTYPCRRTASGCPLCDPPNWPTYTLPPAPVFHPPGCICPPTSEKTCENPACPRKGVKVSAGALPRASTVAGPVTDIELATAFRYVLEKPSTSYLQRKMGLGYNRAAAIMEELEAEGCISAPDESGKRSVLKRDRFSDGLSQFPQVLGPTSPASGDASARGQSPRE